MYIIFAGEKYYPYGGAYDIINYYNSYNDSLVKFKEIYNTYDWIQILDIETREILKQKHLI